jgi:hypothetical protein
MTADLTEPTDGSLTRACISERNEVNELFQEAKDRAAAWAPDFDRSLTESVEEQAARWAVDFT